MKKLIKAIKSFFTSDLESHKNSSSNILDVFTRTIDDLTEVNSGIELSIQSRVKTIDKLQDEGSQLTKLRESNSKIISKLNSIMK